MNIYEPHLRNAAFPPDGILLRAGDRIRYRDVGALDQPGSPLARWGKLRTQS